MALAQDDGPVVCTADYDPLCGCNENGCQTYSNRCHLNISGQQYDESNITEGACNGDSPTTESSSTTILLCPMIYRPVCGCNGNGCTTYGNRCLLGSSNEKYEESNISDGRCPGDGESSSPCGEQSTSSTPACPIGGNRHVCGCNENGCKTYASRCFLDNSNEEYEESNITERICPNEDANSTPSSSESSSTIEACTLIYRPICGCNESGCKTYGNRCVLDKSDEEYDESNITEGVCPGQSDETESSPNPSPVADNIE